MQWSPNPDWLMVCVVSIISNLPCFATFIDPAFDNEPFMIPSPQHARPRSRHIVFVDPFHLVLQKRRSRKHGLSFQTCTPRHSLAYVYSNADKRLGGLMQGKKNLVVLSIGRSRDPTATSSDVGRSHPHPVPVFVAEG